MPAFENPVFESAAKSLADLEQPDFAGFSTSEVNAAMSTVLTPNGPDPNWLAQMKSRIQELTSNFTKLEDAAANEVPPQFQIKTMGVTYYRLTDGSRTQLVIISVSQPPFKFV